MSYRSFLGSTRAEYARMMLNTTSFSVLEIALECGYPNLRSMQRHFKDFMGVSPTEYRKQRLARNTVSTSMQGRVAVPPSEDFDSDTSVDFSYSYDSNACSEIDCGCSEIDFGCSEI